MAQITLLADEHSIRNPELLGLDGENLNDQEWLNLIESAPAARRFAAHARGACEFWVAGSDSVDAINLAAAIKHDRGDHKVALVAFEPTGSTVTRAQAAGLDAVLNRVAFVKRYQTAKAALAPRVGEEAAFGVEDPAAAASAAAPERGQAESAGALFGAGVRVIDGASAPRSGLDVGLQVADEPFAAVAEAGMLPAHEAAPATRVRSAGAVFGTGRPLGDSAGLFEFDDGAGCGQGSASVSGASDPAGLRASSADALSVSDTAQLPASRTGELPPAALGEVPAPQPGPAPALQPDPAAAEQAAAPGAVQAELPEAGGQAAPAQPGYPERRARERARYNPAVVARNLSVRQKAGCVVAVTGAGGGSGKSTVAVLAAYIAARKGLSCALVDADLQFGDVHNLVGQEGVLRLDEAVAAPERLQALLPEPGQPAVVAAPSKLEQSELIASQMPMVVDTLRRSFDCVVLSLGNGMSEWQLSLLESATSIVFLLDQRPASIWACRHTLDLLARCGIATNNYRFALNRCSRQSLFSSIDASCALGGTPVAELSDGGREVGELLGAGQPADLFDSRNALVSSLADLLEGMLPAAASSASSGRPAPQPRQRRFFALRRKKAACL